MRPEFKSFEKIPRLERLVWSITEKIDGTNGIIHITEGAVYAGSRSRWLINDGSKGWDNYGFGAWVESHADELRSLLGPGRHVGEWWGAGIQRCYGQQEKRFSLFSPWRYPDIPEAGSPEASGCIISRVPLLASSSDLSTIGGWVEACSNLLTFGSTAAPGFPNPEGLVVTIGNQNYKLIINHSDKSKSRDGA